MPSHLYITGTDTDVGKTFVAVQLIRHLVSKGEQVAVMKPVASGAEADANDKLRNSDAILLRDAANISANYADTNPYVFAPAIAPEYAARESNTAVDIDVIRNAFRRIQNGAGHVIVEGAGGWLSPVNEQLDQRDIAHALGIEDVILVVGMRLGCVHSARATMQAIAQSGMTLKGWVANEATDIDSHFADNVNTIQRYANAPLLAAIRHNDESVEWYF